MLKTIKKTIKKYDLFEKGEKLLLAVSGGADSIAMLDAFVSLGKYNIAVAHFNHLTRGMESDKDEIFVQTLAEEYNIPFYVGRADIKRLVKDQGGSFQSVARDIRYQFLRKTAQEIEANKIVLAHHADDQVETVIINLLRGSGLKGISGMAFSEGDLVRPLLEVTREEIEQYILKEKLNFRLDISNLETYYTRNRLRHEIVPLLSKFNPALSATIGKMAEIIRDEDNYLSKTTSEYFVLVSDKEQEHLTFKLDIFNTLDIALQRRLILKGLTETAGTEKDFSFRNVEDILKISTTGSGLVLHLPNSIRVKTTYGKLHFYKSEMIAKYFEPFNIELNIPGKTIIEGIGDFTAEYVNCDGNVKSDAYDVYLHEENIFLPLRCRSRLPGDIVRLLGGKGKVKLKDFFIDMHIERQLRDTIPLVVDTGGEIIWIAGMRPTERCRISNSGRMLKISFKPLKV